uniref:Fatty acid desaturase C1 n=1 Tax=Hemicentrotus pulcherrimus TaxID=7650 RepID=A0AA96WMW3_HEMPU|nr:Fatty acid desaturase C1 [Hemicentrotus pulcherrimus]
MRKSKDLSSDGTTSADPADATHRNRSGESTPSSAIFTWDEIRTHVLPEDKWLVIDGDVYDISIWSRRHPGGKAIISHYAGQDASDAFGAFHRDRQYVSKYLNMYRIGKVKGYDNQMSDLSRDFSDLRDLTKKMGLYNPNYWFYVFHLSHIIALEIAAYLVVSLLGGSVLSWILAAVLIGTSQTQGSWLNHDFGHLSVFKSTKANLIAQKLVFTGIQGVSASWWKYRHYLHHSKPNVIDKDPDIKMEVFLLVGDTIPIEMAKSKKGFMPYQHQHQYFTVLSPLLLVVYYYYEVLRFVFKRREWLDLFLMTLYFVRYFYLFLPLTGFFGAYIILYLGRVIQSAWFVWVSQSNHIPMAVEHDVEDKHWVPLQMHATCNLESSPFIDWFTGHLNFQIEHHLFPTMPRHNLSKIKPQVVSLCKKHNIPYINKPFWTAMFDILRSLRKSGNLWYDMSHTNDLLMQ